MIEARFSLREGERLDSLIQGGFQIIQNPQEFCFSVDSYWLADFATCKPRDRVYDLGTGTGVLAFLLAVRGVRDVVAIEKNPVMADIAQRNVIGNRCEERIVVKEADYRDAKTLFPEGDADLVIVNPPYGEPGRGALSVQQGVRAAKQEVTATREDVLNAAVHLLRFGGRLALVQRAERAAEWIAAMENKNLRIKRLRWVHSHWGEPAKAVLIEARWQGQAGVQVLPPLIVHREDGGYSDEMLRIYGKVGR